jgi:hypothetical protein
MKTFSREGVPAVPFYSVLVTFVLLSISPHTMATVTITNDWATLFSLEKPTGEFDEPSLSGFEYLISSRTGEFRENDQYMIVGEEPTATTSLISNLGAVNELSGTAWDFSIQHNLIGGRNFTFTMDGPAGAGSELCWGENCPPGSTSMQTLDGQAPINQYNGLQIQVRAQDVTNSSATISNLSLTGVTMDPTSPALFDGTVTPLTLGTFPFETGRVGQWLLGDNLDFTSNEWELTGTVTLTREDLALEDLTKVRFAVDLVDDTRLVLEPVPVPASVWLFVSALIGLVGIGRKPRA